MSLLALLAALLAGGCSRPSGSPAELVAGMALRERVAQLVVAPLPADPAPALPHLRRLTAGSGIAGVYALGGTPPDVLARAIRALQAGARPPLLVVAELDGGLGTLFAGATDFPVAATLAALAPPEESRAAARHIAREAREVGINLGLIGTPPLGGTDPLPLPARDPERAARGLDAFLVGAADQGLPIAVEALRPARSDAPVLDWDRARLEAVDLPLLAATLRRGAQVVLLGPARLPSLTADSLPLPFSPAAVRGLLRNDLGWEGVVAADLGPGSVLVRRVGAGEAAVRALAAGADLLLRPEHPDSVISAVVAAVEAGRLPGERVDSAATRVLTLRTRLPPPASPSDTLPPRLRDPEALALAGRLSLGTALGLSAGPAAEALAATPPDSILLVTPVGRGRALETVLEERLAGIRQLSLNLTADSAALVARLARERAGTALLLLADFPAGGTQPSLRSLALSAFPVDSAAPRRLLLRFHPEALELPGEADPAVVVWGVGPVSQLAAAEMLLSGERAGGDPIPGLRWPPAPVLRSAEPAAVGMDAAALDAADRVVREAVEQGVFPGAALAVGRRGALVRLRGYGRFGDDGDAAVSAESTLYDVASLSKVIGTTTAVALLVEEGRMRLDTPVQRYLPEFQGEGKEEVTIRHLLTHTSGLPSGLWLYGSARSPDAALSQVMRQRLLRPPGARVEYSDLGMILLAEAVERAAEMPLDRFLALRLFAPLGMSSTMYLPPLSLRERIVPTTIRGEQGFPLRGIVHDANAFRLGGVAGHAGLFSTARDVAVFAQMMLNGGSYGSAEVLSGEIVAEFTRRQRGAGERALGWDTPAARSSAGRYFSARSYGHTGFTGTSLWIDPERELFVVLLTNRTYTASSAREMLRVRAAVHDAVARAIRDQPVTER